MSQPQWYVYILESESTGRFYYGCTSDLQRRLAEHNSRHSPSTRGRGPWQIIWACSVADKKEAQQLEKWLKRCKNKQYIRRYMQEHPGEDLGKL